MTLGEILAVLPRSARYEATRIIENSASDTVGMLRAARLLREVLTPHAERLERLGLVPDFAAYALVYYSHNPNGDIQAWTAALEEETRKLEEETRKLEGQVQVLRQLQGETPSN